MRRVFSNGGSGDFVVGALQRAVAKSDAAFLAAPYFDYSDLILEAAKRDVRISLLICLNSATQPTAVDAVAEHPNVSIRYFTDRFHAKIFIFDECAILGSANLTNRGLHVNREAVVVFDRDEDADTIEEVRALFLSLWDEARVLTDEARKVFRQSWLSAPRRVDDADRMIEDALGRATPANIDVQSKKKSSQRLFLEGLRRQVYEQYRPAFLEVQKHLVESGVQRPELQGLVEEHLTNRFLNWVRLSKAQGEDAWRSASLRQAEDRRAAVVRFGSEWTQSTEHRIGDDYARRISEVTRVFGSAADLEVASQDDITSGLLALHAFSEQLRFVKGGLESLPGEFWRENQQNVDRVRRTLSYLLHGPDDFAVRLHDVVYDQKWKLRQFSLFCALELFGTVFPKKLPPLNGRMAKALRFLGFDVRGV